MLVNNNVGYYIGFSRNLEERCIEHVTYAYNDAGCPGVRAMIKHTHPTKVSMMEIASDRHMYLTKKQWLEIEFLLVMTCVVGVAFDNLIGFWVCQVSQVQTSCITTVRRLPLNYFLNVLVRQNC